MVKVRWKNWVLVVCLLLSVISSLGLYRSVSAAHSLISASQTLNSQSGSINWAMETEAAAEATATMLYEIFTWVSFMVIIWGSYFAIKLTRENRLPRGIG